MDRLKPVVQKENKEPIYKRGWFWVVVCAILFVIFVISKACENKEQTNNSPQNTVVQETTVSKSVFKDSCKTIDYRTLARNPDKYKGNNYVMKGKVIQVQEHRLSDTVQLRINVTYNKSEYSGFDSWDDTIYATVEIPAGEDKLLEDDVITFWGICEGNYTYETVMGNNVSLPKIDIKYYKLNN